MITKQKVNNFYKEHKEVLALNICFSILLCFSGAIAYLVFWFAQKPPSIMSILVILMIIQLGVNTLFAFLISVGNLLDKLTKN